MNGYKQVWTGLVVLGLIVTAGPIVIASDRADLSSCETREERYRQFIDFRSMVQGGTVNPTWLDDGKRFTYSPDGESVFIVQTRSGKQKPHSEQPDPDPDVAEATDETPSPNGRWFVTARDENLWNRPAEAEESQQLTKDGEEDFSWSTEDARWSGDGNRFAVHRYDARTLHKMPVVKWLGHAEEVDWIPYPYAGEPKYEEQLAIVDLAAGKVIRIDTGEEAGQMYVLLDWRKDDSELLFLRFDRLLKSVELRAADPATGATRSIVGDRQATFVEGLHVVFVMDSFHHALDDDRQFIWRSERDGWAHLYLYRYDGTLVRRLTAGDFEVQQVLAVDADKGWIYFMAQADPANPSDRHLYRVDLQGKRMKQLTEGTGSHRVSLSPALNGFIDNHSVFDRPPTAELRSIDGKLVTTLAQADVTALNALDWSPPESFVVHAADGTTEIHGLLYKPHDFDADRKYPVIEVIYAGSQMPAVPRTFVPSEYGHFAQILAQLGFVTVVLDAPGTPGRGKAFQDVVYRSIGRHEIPDHAAALRGLAAERPFMDMNRVGVHGKSWGGYFALRAMLQAPDVYHVGVASAVAAELETAAYSPIAPYMESPEENPKGYAFASNLGMADALQGKLLITASTGDLNTPFAQTMKMVDAFIQAGKPVDLMIFPDQHHWLQGPSLDYFYETLKSYFVEHLRPESCRE